MANPSPILKGVIHGRTIELRSEPGLPDGQEVSVEIRPVDEAPLWLERLVVDPSVRPGKFVVKETRLLAEDLAGLVEEGRTDAELLGLYQELTPEDVAAIRQYAAVPSGLRRAFGGWAEDADELNEYLDWTRRQRRSVARRSGSELPAGHRHLFRLLERQRSGEQPVHSIRGPLAPLHGDAG